MDLFYPLSRLSDYLVYDLFGISIETHLGTALNFFIYDSLKILILLVIIGYFMAVVRHYLPTEKLRDFLSSRKWYGLDYFLASLFGIVTPFCSCSSIPLFVGFLGAGIPLGVTLTFLIVSPLVNEIAIVLFTGLFGWKITILYVISAIVLGMLVGFILSKLKLEKYVSDSIWRTKVKNSNLANETKITKKLLIHFGREGWSITRKIMPYVLLGIGVGSIIHGYIPAGYFEKYISADNFLAVPIATIVAVPVYANSVAVIPIIQPLIEKGVPLGTALAFMMATVGLSLPEALILKKVMATKLLLLFFSITAINIMIIGLLFNFFG